MGPVIQSPKALNAPGRGREVRGSTGVSAADADTVEMSALVADLRDQGFAILPGVFTTAEIEDFRETVTRHLGLMARTRSIAHAYHLAGFHRVETLVPLHAAIATNEPVQNFLCRYYDGQSFETIGLTDITVNRSQHWHTDLLRGAYSGFLADGSPWHETGHSCLKVLVYLQPGKSLRIAPGSHVAPSPLDDDQLEILAQASNPIQLHVEAGDVVIMDIRSLHRGSTDAEMSDPGLAHDPKILVSTVFGLSGSRFANAMKQGNALRLADWDRRHLGRDR
jgi:hypothetical protein